MEVVGPSLIDSERQESAQEVIVTAPVAKKEVTFSEEQNEVVQPVEQLVEPIDLNPELVNQVANVVDKQQELTVLGDLQPVTV